MVKEMLGGLLSRTPPQKRPVKVDRDAPVKGAGFVVFDTELTGLDEKTDSIVSVGAIRMTGTRMEVSGSFYKLVKPEKELTKTSVVIHGITPSEVSRKPFIDEVLYEFLQFAGEDILVGHFVSIDLSFVNREMKRIVGYPLRNQAVDTYSIHEWLKVHSEAYGALFPGQTDPGLYTIARRFGIPVNGAHNSEIDAYITAQVFQRYIPMLSERGVSSVGELLSVGAPGKGGEGKARHGEISSL
jgi:DNA polymerase III subunit epsilon